MGFYCARHRTLLENLQTLSSDVAEQVADCALCVRPLICHSKDSEHDKLPDDFGGASTQQMVGPCSQSWSAGQRDVIEANSFEDDDVCLVIGREARRLS